MGDHNHQRNPLLPSVDPYEQSGVMSVQDDQIAGEPVSDRHHLLTMGKSMRTIFVQSLPVCISFIFIFADDPFIISFLNTAADSAKQSKLWVGAFGIGGAYSAILTVSVIMALNQGLTSRASQSFGNGNYRLCGLTFHRSVLIILIVLSPLIVAMFFAKPILIAFGIREDVATAAEPYLLWSIPGSISTSGYLTMCAILNACGKFYVPGIIQTIICTIEIFFAYLMIVVWKWGLVGAAVSSSIIWTLGLLFILCYIKWRKILPQVFFWPVKESFQGLWELFKYQVTVGLMSWFDFVAVELVSLVSGKLNEDELDGYTIGSTISSFMQPFSYAVCIACLTYVGISIGNFNPKQAKRYLWACLYWIWLSSAFLIAISLPFMNSLLKNFTPDGESQKYAAGVFVWSLILAPFDGSGLIMSSAVKSIGLEKPGSVLVGICDFLIFLPVTWLLTFPLGLQPDGLVIGTLIGKLAKIACYSYLFVTNDWEKLSEKLSKIIRDKKLHAMPDDDPEAKQSITSDMPNNKVLPTNI